MSTDATPAVTSSASILTIPNPTQPQLDAVTMAHLKTLSTSEEAAATIFKNLNQQAKQAIYRQERTAAIAAFLKSNANIVGTKIQIDRAGISIPGGSSIHTSRVNPKGTATITQVLENGNVIVECLVSVETPADNIAGLIV